MEQLVMQANDPGVEVLAADKVPDMGMPSTLLSFSDDFEAPAARSNSTGASAPAVHWAAGSWDYSRWGPGVGGKSQGHEADGGNRWKTSYLDLS
jgi:hypothetical protein